MNSAIRVRFASSYFRIGLTKIVFLFLGLTILTDATIRAASPEELIAKVRATPPGGYGPHDRAFYDMHGNADETLQALMKQRFNATAAICRALETPNLPRQQMCALYDVLAFVKDPASIPWLEHRWEAGRADIIYECWLNGDWRDHLYGLYGALHEDLKWLPDPDQWSAFFRRRIAQEKDSTRKLQLERILAGWFHDHNTIDFFKAIERQASPQSEELLCAQLYLKQHKQSYDGRKTAAAIAALTTSDAGAKLLLEYADHIRDPLFVPWLIENLNKPAGEEKLRDPQSVLEEITFARDIASKAQWERWYQLHKTENRQHWMANAITEFNRVLEKDPLRAEAILKETVYRWNDRDLLPYMKQLADHPKLANDAVGWLNLSYHPYWREDLAPLAKQIIEKHREKLAPWAVQLLKGLDFLPDPQTTWDRYVVICNSRV